MLHSVLLASAPGHTRTNCRKREGDSACAGRYGGPPAVAYLRQSIARSNHLLPALFAMQGRSQQSRTGIARSIDRAQQAAARTRARQQFCSHPCLTSHSTNSAHAHCVLARAATKLQTRSSSTCLLQAASNAATCRPKHKQVQPTLKTHTRFASLPPLRHQPQPWLRGRRQPQGGAQGRRGPCAIQLGGADHSQRHRLTGTPRHHLAQHRTQPGTPTPNWAARRRSR
jgi:hypothetical protein